MQKLARAVIGTNNMDNCSRYCQAPATMGLFRTVGYGGDPSSISALEPPPLALHLGHNPPASPPGISTPPTSPHQLYRPKPSPARPRVHPTAPRPAHLP